MAITMVMENMDTHKFFRMQEIAKFFYSILSITPLSFTLSNNALAVDWYIRPYLSMSEIFSDNLKLTDVNKEAGFVTDISPGISINGISPWSNSNINYRLQELYNAGGNDSFSTKHQLQMDSLFQPVRNTFFIKTSSAITQQNLNSSLISTDNISGGGNRSDVKNFTIAPYLTPHFGQYATGLFKIEYSKTTFDNNNTLNIPNIVSDTESFSKQFGLSSGSKFSHLRWNLNYSSNDQYRASGNDVLFEKYNANLRYFLSRKFNLFALGGYENNQFQSLSDISNGAFYTIGGQWSPSLWYSVEAGYGNNKHITLRFNPTDNLTSSVTYQHREIGLNTGSSWDIFLNYRMQNANLMLKYFQDTLSIQQLVINQISSSFSESGSVDNDTTGDVFTIFNNSAVLVDDVVVRKRADISWLYQSGKSSYSATLYNERRQYESLGQQDDVYGVSGFWRWQFLPRINLYFRPNWQIVDNTLTSNNRYDLSFGLNRSFPINLGRPLLMNTKIEFRHINQNSSSTLTNDYIENRATANFAVRF